MSKPEYALEAAKWLRYAQEDLRAAEAMLGQSAVAPRHVCFLAQQAVEKSLKAVLIFSQIRFPFRHDLDQLRNLIPEGWSVCDRSIDLAELTEWAVDARYPVADEDPTSQDAQQSVELARLVCRLVVSDLLKQGLD